MVVPEFDKIVGESYHQQFAADSILSIDVDEMRMRKLLSKQDLACLKRLLVKFRFHLKESHENVEKHKQKQDDILLEHSVFISDLMIKRTLDLQLAAKHEKDKNNRSEEFMISVSLFKKGLVAFEKQQTQLRRHLARLTYAQTDEGAAYFREQAREELTIIVREKREEYKKKEAELAAQESAKALQNGENGNKESEDDGESGKELKESKED